MKNSKDNQMARYKTLSLTLASLLAYANINAAVFLPEDRAVFHTILIEESRFLQKPLSPEVFSAIAEQKNILTDYDKNAIFETMASFNQLSSQAKEIVIQMMKDSAPSLPQEKIKDKFKIPFEESQRTYFKEQPPQETISEDLSNLPQPSSLPQGEAPIDIDELSTRIARGLGKEFGFQDEKRSSFMEASIDWIRKKIQANSNFASYSPESTENCLRQIKEKKIFINIKPTSNPVSGDIPKIGLISILNKIATQFLEKNPNTNKAFVMDEVMLFKNSLEKFVSSRQHEIWIYQDEAVFEKATYDNVCSQIFKHIEENLTPQEDLQTILKDFGIHTTSPQDAQNQFNQLTLEAITKQYRKEALKRHPDKNGSEADFQALSEAYATLKKMKGYI